MEEFMRRLFAANDPRSDEEREADSRKIISERVVAAERLATNDMVVCSQEQRYAITGDDVICRVVTAEPDESGRILVTPVAPTVRSGMLPKFGMRYPVDPTAFRRANEFDIKAAANELGVRTLELLKRAPASQREDLARQFAEVLIENCCPKHGDDEQIKETNT